MTHEEKEILRHALLEVLAVRFPTAHNTRAIRRMVAREVAFPVAEEDVQRELMMLVGLKHASVTPDPLGSTQHFAATPDGVIANERGGK